MFLSDSEFPGKLLSTDQVTELDRTSEGPNGTVCLSDLCDLVNTQLNTSRHGRATLLSQTVIGSVCIDFTKFFLQFFCWRIRLKYY